MTKSQMLALVRKLIADEQATGFTEGGNLEEPEGTQELLNYLDRAVDDYSKRQASNTDIRLVKKLTIEASGTTRPNDFLSFCGCVPAVIDSSTLKYKGEDPTITAVECNYFARLKYISDYLDTDTLVLDYDQYMTIAALAAIYALNKHEFNVSQDLMLLGMGVQNGNS